MSILSLEHFDEPFARVAEESRSELIKQVWEVEDKYWREDRGMAAGNGHRS